MNKLLISSILSTVILTSFYFVTKTENPDLIVTIESVYDGDTFYCTIPDVHPVFGKHIGVRVYGIDCPELRTKDEEEKFHAKESKKFAEEILLGKTVTLKNPQRDKYFRLLSSVKLESGEDYSQKIIAAKLARPYFGEQKEKWEFDK